MVNGVGMPAEEATVPASDPGFSVGWAVFETMRSGLDGVPTHLDAHLDRLAVSLRAARIPPVDRALLRAELRAVAERVGGRARLRVTVTGGGNRVVLGTPLDVLRLHHPVRARTGPHRDEPFLGGAVKHTSRAPWIVAVRRSGVDEVLLVDDEGRFTEGTSSGILAVWKGVVWTAPHDGRILESTTVHDVLARAETQGVEVRREGPGVAGPWDALYIASATRDLAPVIELDGRPLPGWDPVGRRLAGLT